MDRICYGNIKPSTFEEHINFNYDVPHTIRRKNLSMDDIVPLHYSDATIEILLCNNLVGNISIENRHFHFQGKQVFIIPPNTVHSMTVSSCKGIMYVLKFSFQALAEFLNIKNILAYNNFDISQLPFTCTAYDKLMKIVKIMIREDNNIFSRMRSILSIFELLEGLKAEDLNIEYYSEQKSNDILKSLITWTTENHEKKITINQAADFVNYSKYHFCRWFKSITGITYITYLNRVRIVHACRLLLHGHSISETCFECGFEDVSYFLQVFKKIQGCTPKQYIEHAEKNFIEKI